MIVLLIAVCAIAVVPRVLQVAHWALDGAMNAATVVRFRHASQFFFGSLVMLVAAVQTQILVFEIVAGIGLGVCLIGLQKSFLALAATTTGGGASSAVRTGCVFAGAGVIAIVFGKSQHAAGFTLGGLLTFLVGLAALVTAGRKWALGWKEPFARRWLRLLIGGGAAIFGCDYVLFRFTAVRAVALWWGLVALSMALVYLGSQIHAVRYIAKVNPPTFWILRTVVGCLLFFGAVLYLSQAWASNVGIVFAGVLAGLLLVAARNTSADFGAVGLVSVMIFSFVPRDVPAPIAVQPYPDANVFVAIGDSYMSGEGAAQFFTGTSTKIAPRPSPLSSQFIAHENGCRRSPSAYPALLAGGNYGIGVDRAVFLACSGATAGPLRDGHLETEQPGENRIARQIRVYKDRYRTAPDRAETDRVKVKFVLVSIGGNDAGFGNLIEACLTPGDCSRIGERWVSNFPVVQQRVEAAYSAVAATFPGVPIYAIPYPNPISANRCAWSPFTANEHRFLHGFTDDLNATIERAAKSRNVTVITDVEGAFEREHLQICSRGEDRRVQKPSQIGVNFLAANPVGGTVDDQVNPLNWTHNSMHPNARGHEVLANTIAAWLHKDPTLRAAAPTPFNDMKQILQSAYHQDADAAMVTLDAEQAPKGSAWWVVQFARGTNGLSWLAVLGLVVGYWLVILEILRRRNTKPNLFDALKQVLV